MFDFFEYSFEKSTLFFYDGGGDGDDVCGKWNDDDDDDVYFQQNDLQLKESLTKGIPAISKHSFYVNSYNNTFHIIIRGNSALMLVER